MRASFALVGLTAALLLLIAGCTADSYAPPPEEPAPPSPVFAAALQGIGIQVPQRGKQVVVNIPSFELVALQDREPILRSRVIVGRRSTPTPELVTAIWAVTFNPSWTPTPSMVRWEGARPVPPGPQNPLGRLLFELDNDQLIFLHDTNERSYFDQPVRAFSHGCVRVEQARALAAWVLDVTEAEIDRLIARSGTHRELLRASIPVALVYRTGFPGQAGRLLDHPDIYRLQSVAKAVSADSSPGRCAGPL